MRNKNIPSPSTLSPFAGQTQVNPIMPDKEKRLDVLSLERLLQARRQAYEGMSLDRVISRDARVQLNQFVPIAHSHLGEDKAIRKGVVRCTETKKEGGGNGDKQHQWAPVYEMLLMGEMGNGGSLEVGRIVRKIVNVPTPLNPNASLQCFLSRAA